MAALGVSIAIMDGEGRILLEKREDFHVWGLPGGEIEPGKSAAQAALREAREETGLEVRLMAMVGLYSLPKWRGFNDHNVLFAAAPAGGQLLTVTDETVDVGFFARNDLPDPLMPWHRQRIYDALAGIGGSAAVFQDMEYPFMDGITRRELYRERDESGVSRQQYFVGLMQGCPVRDIVEVKGKAG